MNEPIIFFIEPIQAGARADPQHARMVAVYCRDLIIAEAERIVRFAFIM